MPGDLMKHIAVKPSQQTIITARPVTQQIHTIIAQHIHLFGYGNEFLFDVKNGISVSKKLGNSVFRNKYKRKLRAIIDNYKKRYINYQDYIIILRKEAVDKPHEQLEQEFFALMNIEKKGIQNEK